MLVVLFHVPAALLFAVSPDAPLNQAGVKKGTWLELSFASESGFISERQKVLAVKTMPKLRDNQAVTQVPSRSFRIVKARRKSVVLSINSGLRSFAVCHFGGCLGCKRRKHFNNNLGGLMESTQRWQANRSSG